jgi:outer membrane biosynthesis protein TonB
MAGGIAAFLQYDEENISFLTNDSTKLIKEIMNYKEEAYVQMAAQWMTKAKETETTVFDFIKKNTNLKPKSKSKPKPKEEPKPKPKEEPKPKPKEEPKPKPKEEPKPKPKENQKKRSSQTSLEKFMEK